MWHPSDLRQKSYASADDGGAVSAMAEAMLEYLHQDAGRAEVDDRSTVAHTERLHSPRLRCFQRENQWSVQLGFKVTGIARTKFNITSDCLRDIGSSFVLTVYSQSLSHDQVWPQRSGNLKSEFSFFLDGLPFRAHEFHIPENISVESKKSVSNRYLISVLLQSMLNNLFANEKQT